MEQRPLQDRVTVVLFLVFLLLVATAAGIPGPSGIELSETTRTRVQPDNSTGLLPIHRRNGFNHCEVVYQLASGQGDHAGLTAPGTGQDDMGARYYAVYTCTGVTATAGNYI